MSGVTSSTALWYASRATGIVCLLLFTAVVILGILVNRQGRLPGLPQFAVTGLHRNLSLLTTAFLVVHVLTAVADSYVSIQLIAAIIPFTSSYEPLWMGLGAVALDLIAAVIITSLVRLRLGRRLWRAVHWFTYVAFPMTVAHSIGSGKDLQSGIVLAVTVACVLAVAAAIAYRLAGAAAEARQARLRSPMAHLAPRRPAPSRAPGRYSGPPRCPRLPRSRPQAHRRPTIIAAPTKTVVHSRCGNAPFAPHSQGGGAAWGTPAERSGSATSPCPWVTKKAAVNLRRDRDHRADHSCPDAQRPCSTLLVGASRTELNPSQDANDRQQKPRREQDVHSKAEDGQGHDSDEDEGDYREHGDRSPVLSQCSC